MDIREFSEHVQHVQEMLRQDAPVPTPIEAVLYKYSFAESHKVLDVVIDNWKLLRDAGFLEVAFLDAWCSNKAGTPNWTIGFAHAVFAQLDKDKLLRAGDNLPDGDIFTVYRGVAGVGAERRIRGYSWTDKEAIAKNFADLRVDRYKLSNPSVYRAKVQRRNVLAYIHESGRNESEFLINPSGLSGVWRMPTI